MLISEGNIYNSHASTSREEVINTLLSGKNIKIEQIISSGQTSPAEGWFDQMQHEWVLLLQGEAQLEFEKKLIKHLHRGDFLLIPPHCKHKVVYTSTDPSCIWLAVFFD
ncbi:MAG TPA: cupin domain-containing protein [Bacteroidales bacterium]|nr:cupin domain-containing protein [Bacteroidales bacterium]